MRTFVKLAAALLIGAFATSASAHIEFIKAKFVSLEQDGQRWTLKLEIHEWLNNGGYQERPPRPATIYFKRAPNCIRQNHIYLGTPEEYERALAVLREQLAAGGLHGFGFNVTPLSEKRDEFIAVNLRVGKSFEDGAPLVWAVATQGGYCGLRPAKKS